MPLLFFTLVSILIVGWLWFFVARPILEDFGILAPAYDDDDMSSDDDGNDRGIVVDVAAPLQEATTRIATQQNGNNTALLLQGQQPAANNVQLDKMIDEAVFDAQIATIAAIMEEAKKAPFAAGQVPQTRVIKAVFGVAPSSTDTRYRRIVEALKAGQQPAQEEPKADPIFRHNGVVLTDPDHPYQPPPVVEPHPA